MMMKHILIAITLEWIASFHCQLCGFSRKNEYIHAQRKLADLSKLPPLLKAMTDQLQNLKEAKVDGNKPHISQDGHLFFSSHIHFYF